jgi:hypothetical protein
MPSVSASDREFLRSGISQEGWDKTFPEDEEEEEEVKEDNNQEVVVLGFKFHSLTKQDWYGFAGAEPDTLIAEDRREEGTVVLLYSPSKQEVYEIAAEPEKLGFQERTWKLVNEM